MTQVVSINSRVSRDAHRLHFAVADKFCAAVVPGPCVLFRDGRFFLADDNGFAYWINETTDRFSGAFDPHANDAEENAIATFGELTGGV